MACQLFLLTSWNDRWAHRFDKDPFVNWVLNYMGGSLDSRCDREAVAKCYIRRDYIRWAIGSYVERS